MALDLFAENGYEKTSLREIAERLGVTKAALYYHFKSKEDIVVSLFDDLLSAVDELIAWGRRQPVSPQTRRELLRRYTEVMRDDGRRLMRCLHENQPAFRELKPGAAMRDRFRTLSALMAAPDAAPVDAFRARVALFTINAGEFLLDDLGLTADERQDIAHQVSLELLTGQT
ncbi:MAG: TetR/AcrR family transcriptional regulator [Actinomadura sp.]